MSYSRSTEAICYFRNRDARQHRHRKEGDGSESSGWRAGSKYAASDRYFPDVFDQLRNLLIRNSEEANAMLREQLGVAGQVAEARDNQIRDEIKLVKAEMNFEKK